MGVQWEGRRVTLPPGLGAAVGGSPAGIAADPIQAARALPGMAPQLPWTARNSTAPHGNLYWKPFPFEFLYYLLNTSLFISLSLFLFSLSLSPCLLLFSLSFLSLPSLFPSLFSDSIKPWKAPVAQTPVWFVPDPSGAVLALIQRDPECSWVKCCMSQSCGHSRKPLAAGWDHTAAMGVQ